MGGGYNIMLLCCYSSVCASTQLIHDEIESTLCSVMFLTYLVITDTPGDGDPLPFSDNVGKLYVHVEIRLSSFNNWPIPMSQTKEQLAATGFFYTGSGDSTTCYHCGLSLNNWEPVDNPWNQHVKWFPGCLFLNLSKERAFIDDFSDALSPSSSTRIERIEPHHQETQKLHPSSPGGQWKAEPSTTNKQDH
ncbi:hypothetical protein QAD02_007334 [Eretmocerus hayati]|uniref:Uncharacterized protein n=1 Tax=Eretmocerus hayati TaxID=131215 RepID=A0ACC2N3E4_9HYME|nr:hypothetical protein QAD02_007334 [Eretmocerus hayati]